MHSAKIENFFGGMKGKVTTPDGASRLARDSKKEELRGDSKEEGCGARAGGMKVKSGGGWVYYELKKRMDRVYVHVAGPDLT